MRLNRCMLAAFVGTILLVAPDVGATQNLPAGKALAEKLCSSCHAVGREGASKLAIAPPFREIARRYSVWGLQEALAEGIVVGHPAMPEFTLEPAEIMNLLAYMEILGKR